VVLIQTLQRIAMALLYQHPNNREISPPHQTWCSYLLLEDARFDPTSPMAGYRITPVLVFWTGRAVYWVKFTF
jgi:hypothetical protein